VINQPVEPNVSVEDAFKVLFQHLTGFCRRAATGCRPSVAYRTLAKISHTDCIGSFRTANSLATCLV